MYSNPSFLSVPWTVGLTSCKTRGGGALALESGTGCAAVMTPFFQASWRSLAYQFTGNAPLMCPPIFNFWKYFAFSSLDPNFCSQDPNFSKKICSFDPTFGNLCGTHPPPKKKSWVPPRGPKTSNNQNKELLLTSLQVCCKVSGLFTPWLFWYPVAWKSSSFLIFFKNTYDNIILL